MTTESPAWSFHQDNLLARLNGLEAPRLDELPFGVIGFGRDGIVTQYNRFEMDATGLKREYVLGKHVFQEIAQCMNNFMVAQRFEDAWSDQQTLDVVVDYVITWRMKPTKVQLRLLSDQAHPSSYIVLTHRSALKS